MAGFFSRVLSALFPKQMTKEEFLAKAKDVHGNKYDYSKVRYKDEDTRVTIICPIHGKFLATPKAHIEGEGCPKCANGLSEEPQAENTTDVDAYLAFLNSQKKESEDSGLFNNEMLDDIFGLNSDDAEEQYIGEYSDDRKTLLKCPRDFKGTYTVPKGVTSIKDFAFNDCRELEEVILPDSIKEIGEGAFYMCLSLRSIIIPKHVQEIKESTFHSCTSLRKITIPSNVFTIGAAAFYHCTNLTTVIIKRGVDSIQHDAFSGCSSLQHITFPDGITAIGSRALCNCEALTGITLTRDIRTIGQEFVDLCPRLKEITVPKGTKQFFQTTKGLQEFSSLIKENDSIKEPINFIDLCNQPKYRGYVTIAGRKVFVEDCYGNVSYFVNEKDPFHEEALPVKAYWKGNRVVVERSDNLDPAYKYVDQWGHVRAEIIH